MRIAALTLPALTVLLAGCAMFGSNQEQSPFAQPNSLMAGEIQNRVQQIPFQHREELVENLLWLSQVGETAIPALLDGLQSDEAKVRSSSAWVLGRIHDRRTIPYLQPLTTDGNETVRLEAARTLVLMGDLQPAPQLIEGLDSEKKEVRYLCHEALKASTGRDFGYDHLSEDMTQRQTAVLNWRQWWGDYSGDTFFASNYQQQHGLQAATPMVETQSPTEPMPTQPQIQWHDETEPTTEPQGTEPTTEPGQQGPIVWPTPDPSIQSVIPQNNPNTQGTEPQPNTPPQQHGSIRDPLRPSSGSTGNQQDPGQTSEPNGSTTPQSSGVKPNTNG